MDAVKSKSQVFEEMGKIDPLTFFLIVAIIVLVVLAILIWWCGTVAKKHS